MIKLLAYPLTVIYFICFGLTLVVFQPIQWFGHKVFGYKGHKLSVDCLQFFLLRCLNILGTRFTFKNPHNIQKGIPLIVVANHQSMYDISPLIWYMRKHHIKFVSKKELGKGIPSISYNLRHGGSVLIDRKDALGAVKAIEDFAKRIDENNWAAVIFPEGTRSRDGYPKPFKTKGLLSMLTHAPNALVVPVSINNSWKTLRYGKFPMGIGAHITHTVHEPIDPKTFADKLELIQHVETIITNGIVND